MLSYRNECPGGCGERGSCACYVEGIVDSHLALRDWRPGIHHDDCNCGKCLTGRAVLAAWRNGTEEN